ncbi:hypothetical protein L2E82_17069 [Cichorium intybus]|uniref:Uncharacterized protein n=1 Tax=Cichorium intybus TaxID=13427 RepID=A0ACB9F6L6_CICIN|nr:hypothetical protein L2E82_17069 [Cichorium intybus]
MRVKAPTRWSASSKKLEPATVSICNRCVVDGTFDDDGTGTDGDEEYDGDEDEPDIVEKEVRDDNQVVPWSSTPPPPASSSSGNEEFWSADIGVSMKRQHQDVADRSFEVWKISSAAASLNLIVQKESKQIQKSNDYLCIKRDDIVLTSTNCPDSNKKNSTSF